MLPRPCKPSNAGRKRSTFTWFPVTGPVRDVLDTQDTLRIKAGMDALFKRKATMDLLAAKKQENDRIQNLNNSRLECRRRDNNLLDEVLKFKALDLQGSSKIQGDSVKRRKSCATEMIAEAHAAAFRPLLRAAVSFKVIPKADESCYIRDRPFTVHGVNPSKTMAVKAGFSRLAVKENTRSLAHHCGFQSFSLL